MTYLAAVSCRFSQEAGKGWPGGTKEGLVNRGGGGGRENPLEISKIVKYNKCSDRSTEV